MVVFAAKEFFDCFLQRWSVQESFVLERLFGARKFELHGDSVELLDEGRRLFDSLFAFESQAWDIGYPIGTHAWAQGGIGRGGWYRGITHLQLVGGYNPLIFAKQKM